MKKLSLSILTMFLMVSNSFSQIPLFGLTSSGGANGGGSIVKVNTDGTSFSTAFSFENGGRSPFGGLVAASNGNYYGMTTDGGANGLGVLYEYNPTTSIYSIKHNFAAATGGKPFGSLVEFNSKLYGLTSEGGSNGFGSVFEYDPTAGTFTVRWNFAAATGNTPVGTLTLWNSKLYGTTAEGGANSGGVIFELNPTGWAYTVKHNFTLATGFAPYSPLVIYNSKFYGTTSEGGASNHGAIYEFDPTTSVFALKYSCTFANGSFPTGSLAVSGTSLYGVSKYGGTGTAAASGGTLFQYNISTSVFTLKYSFATAINGTGRRPAGGLVFYNSKLYGSTLEGGSNGVGVLFEYDPTTSTYSVKNTFAQATGFRVQSDLMETGGKIFGTTSQGGTHGFGTIFEFNVSTSVATVKNNFGSATGENPFGGLVEFNSKYYGMTNLGGTNGHGVIFEFNPAGNVYTVKHNFAAATGRNPQGSLVLQNSKFYGLTNWGGAGDFGAIFEFDPTATTYTLKYSFPNTYTSGLRPQGSLAVLNGNLYGCAFYGGTGASTTVNGPGVIFEYNLTSSTYAVEYNFSATSGGTSPDGGSLLAYNSKLYGIAFHNGTNAHGTLFEYDPTANSYTTKHNFANSTGGFAFGGLVNSGAVLYGTAGYGGMNNLGALFSYNLTSSSFSNLYSFSAATGSVPSSTLALTGGKFYGTTFAGGTNGAGTIFEFNPTGNVHTVLKNLATAEGKNPRGELLVGAASGCTFTPTISGNLTICNGSSTVLTAAGGVSYVWSTGATTAAITVNPTATSSYTVSATDSGGCTGTAAATVLVNNLPTISISGDLTICNGESTVLTAAGGSTYVWSTGATTAAITVTPTSTTNYAVTGTDANGCTATAAVTVLVNNLPTASISGDLEICSGESTVLTAAGGSTYVWSTGATTAAITVIPTATTTYTVLATDANGCTATAAATVLVNFAPSISISGNLEICSGESTILTADGGSIYIWSNGATTAATTVTPTATTTYIVTATGGNGCTATAAASVLVNNLPTVSISGNTTICSGESTILTAAGGSTYIWSTSETTAAITVNPTATSSYTVLATDGNGCTGTAEATVLVNTPTLFYQDFDGDGFGNPSISELTCSQPSGYVANSSDCDDTNPAVNPNATELCSNSIDDDCDTEINEGCTPLSMTVTITPSCDLNTANTITVSNAAGGTPPYLYSKNGGTAYQTSNIFSGLSNGTYQIVLKDAVGTTISETITVNLKMTLTTSRVNVLCRGELTGSVTASVSGGYPSISYLWKKGTVTVGTTATVPNLGAGTYKCTATDALGCTKISGNVVITQPAAFLKITATSTPILCAGANNASINLTTTGGKTPYSWLWSDGATTEDRSNLSPGTYTCTATDNNGCTKVSANFNFTEPVVLVLNMTSKNILCFGQTNGTAKGIATGGTGTKNYVWSNGATTQEITGLAAGNYTVTASDANGCLASGETTIVEPTPLVFQSITAELIGTKYKVTIVGTGGTAPLKYRRSTGPVTWTGYTTTGIFNNVVAGNYTFEILDKNGCTASQNTDIPIPSAKPNIFRNQSILENQNIDFYLKPNPASREVFLVFENENPAAGKIFIQNAAGKLLKTIDLGLLLLTGNRISLDDFSSGVVFVSVILENKTAAVQRLVIVN